MESDQGFQERSVFQAHLQVIRVHNSKKRSQNYTRARANECYKCLKLLQDQGQFCGNRDLTQFKAQYAISERDLADLSGETMPNREHLSRRDKSFWFREKVVGGVEQLDFLTKQGKCVLVEEEYYDAASKAYKELLASPPPKGEKPFCQKTTDQKIRAIQKHLKKKYTFPADMLDYLDKTQAPPNEASTASHNVANAEAAGSIPSDNANAMPRPAVVNIAGWDVQPFSTQDRAATRNTAESVEPPEATLDSMSDVEQASMPTDEEDSMAEDSDSFNPGADEDGEFDPAEPLGYDAPDQMAFLTKIDDDPIGMHALSSMRISAGTVEPGPVANDQASAHDTETPARISNEASTVDAVPRPPVVSFNDIPFLPSEGRAATHKSVESLSDSSEASNVTAAKSLQTLESGELSFFDAEQASMSTDQEDSNIEEDRIGPDADVWPDSESDDDVGGSHLGENRAEPTPRKVQETMAKASSNGRLEKSGKIESALERFDANTLPYKYLDSDEPYSKTSQELEGLAGPGDLCCPESR